MTSGRTARVQEGERNSRRDVRPETDMVKEGLEVLVVWLWGSSTWKKLSIQYPERW